MSWRAKLGMFVLTRQEQRAIAFIVLMLVLGLGTEHYRHTHAGPPNASNKMETALPTPAMTPAKLP